jgi:hypothetical protein
MRILSGRGDGGHLQQTGLTGVEIARTSGLLLIDYTGGTFLWNGNTVTGEGGFFSAKGTWIGSNSL